MACCGRRTATGARGCRLAGELVMSRGGLEQPVARPHVAPAHFACMAPRMRLRPRARRRPPARLLQLQLPGCGSCQQPWFLAAQPVPSLVCPAACRRPCPAGSAPGRPSPSRLSWTSGPTASPCCRSRPASSWPCRSGAREAPAAAAAALRGALSAAAAVLRRDAGCSCCGGAAGPRSRVLAGRRRWAFPPGRVRVERICPPASAGT